MWWQMDWDVDEVGRLLFGRPCRLRLAIWIHNHGSGRFYQSEPAEEIIPQSAAGTELRRFVLLGMLSEHRERGNRRVYYEPTSSPLWSVIATAARVLRGK